MKLNDKIKEVISSNLGLDIDFINEGKTIRSLIQQSLRGTPEEGDKPHPRDGIKPSVFVASSLFLAIEEKLDIEIRDQDAIRLEANGTIEDLIEFIGNIECIGMTYSVSHSDSI